MNKMVLLGVTLLPVVRTPAVAQGQAAPTRTIQYEQRSRATTLSDSVLSIGDGRCLLNRVRASSFSMRETRTSAYSTPEGRSCALGVPKAVGPANSARFTVSDYRLGTRCTS